MRKSLHSLQLPVRVYRQVRTGTGGLSEPFGNILAKFRIYLPDRPGALAAFAAAIAKAGGNISSFHYNRSIDSSRVAAEVQLKKEKDLHTLIGYLGENAFSFESAGEKPYDVQITAVENILEIKVRLVNEPGTLAAFAGILADHAANVIYMLYDEDIDRESADIAMVTQDAEEINRLMQAFNEEGYYYRVIYRGADELEVANVIGLKMVEKFFLRLKKILPASDLADIKAIVESSRDLYEDLVNFYREAGNHLEAGDVFEKVLTFASRSRARTGPNFSAAGMPPLALGGEAMLYGFRLPTSENIYLFRYGGELAMIDTGHGIYYEDVKRLIREQGFDPAMVKRIFLTHPDTDHAGAAGYFEEEYRTEVYMHHGGEDVIANQNRAHGISGPLLSLNRYYTRLSTRFTECRFPSHPHRFKTDEKGRIGGFSIIDSFSVGPVGFEVLESRGGHTPGLVFFLSRGYGLLFTSDFLLNVKSLSAEEKDHLGLYRYMLTNPNSDSRVYREETTMLRNMMLALGNDLAAADRNPIILPGHGDYYALPPP